MIAEIATIDIKKDTNDAFEHAIVLAGKVISQAEGYISHDFKRCIEVENRYLLTVKWESLEAHTIGFRNSSLFAEWRAIIGPFFEELPLVQHYSSLG